MIYNILIIEDHPIIIEAYKNIFLNINSNFNIQTANNCQDGYHHIKYSEKNQYDLIILDINLPNNDLKITSGETLGIKIRKYSPKTKICVITMLHDSYRLFNIIKNINPEGFLIKADIGYDEIIKSINHILIKGCPYYSNSIVKVMRLNISTKFVLDEIDIKILHLISTKLTTKEISEIVPLSVAGIEKRKRKLKKTFDITEGDKELIKIASEKGFI